MAKLQEVFVEYCDKSDNCPKIRKTYMKPKEWTKEEMFYKIEAIAKAKRKSRTGQMPILLHLLIYRHSFSFIILLACTVYCKMCPMR